jgi:HTH-type transcriptional regulator, transcriptional repressor of NAD biosynthesis genes
VEVVETYEHGVIIGKFMPVHAGHQYLIDVARSQVRNLTVMVCTLEDEPIPGRLRHEWVKELYPDINVIHVTDENPSYPEENPDFWNIWRRTILSRVARPDVIFTSEDYGEQLAQILGCAHVSVDPMRQQFPVSGNAVRKNPYANWEFLPPPVRAYYAKRVCIVGAESTGKTTLAEALAKRFETEWVPEFAVEYLRNGNADVTSVDVIEAIARGQIRSEGQKARTANRILVCDTDLITTVIYSHYFLKACPEWILRESFASKYDLSLLMNIDIPWVPSKWRDAPHLRSHFHEWFKRELEARGRKFVVISGATREERLEQATKEVSSLFGDQWAPSGRT